MTMRLTAGWATLAIISAFFFGLGDFIVVWSEQRKMNVNTLYAVYTIAIGLLNLLYLTMVHRQGAQEVAAFEGVDWAIVLGLSMTYLIAYLLHFKSIQLAPNPGYANALVMGHVVVLTALSVLVLRKPWNMTTLAGIAVMFVGAYIVIMNAGM